MKFILARKLKMTQKFKDGIAQPVTVLKAGPCVVSQVKNAEKEGYSSIQLGFEKTNKSNKPEAGHQKSVSDDAGAWKVLREFRTKNGESVNIGDLIRVNTFQTGDKVKVQGISKGKGFAGVVKRHGFAGGRASHGNKDQLRMPGSIGAQEPQHVFKGKRMAGRMGADVVTVKNLQVIDIDEENNEIYLRGAVPGRYNSLIKIYADGDLVVSQPEADKPAENPEEVAVEQPAKEEAAQAEEVSKGEAKVEEKAAVQPANEEKEVKEEKKEDAPASENKADDK